MSDGYPYILGDYHRAITCANDQAQLWFDRGMNWVRPALPPALQTTLTSLAQAFGFHHEEAIACFEKAAAADPSCAMAQWGIAYCHGPNYNFHAFNGYHVVSQQESGYPSMKAAFEAVQRAAALTEGCASVEKDLIEALQLLYTWPASSFAAELGPAHSAAMRAVRAKHPDDADVAFVFADSMMTLHPWKLWDLESGEPVALVPELQALLAEALEAAPNHPGLCHLWIHLLEMSPTPELALVRAHAFQKGAATLAAPW